MTASTTSSTVPVCTPRPLTPPPIIVSRLLGSSAAVVELAAEIGDGLASTKPDKDAVHRVERAGGHGPKMAGLKVCWGPDEKACRRTSHICLWRSSGVPGELSQELPTPSFFEQASELVTEDEVADKIPCGPNPGPIVGARREVHRRGLRPRLPQPGRRRAGRVLRVLPTRTELQAELSRGLGRRRERRATGSEPRHERRLCRRPGGAGAGLIGLHKGKGDGAWNPTLSTSIATTRVGGRGRAEHVSSGATAESDRPRRSPAAQSGPRADARGARRHRG